MLTGIFAGITWALETVVLGIALSMHPFVSTKEGLFLAPFISTFIHDATSAFYMLIYNTFKKSFTRKSKELMDLYDFSDCLELVNDFVYLNNGFTSINYYVWSDIKRKIDKNGRLYGWEYLPFAVTFNINQGNETYHTIRYSIGKDGFQELDGKYIVRQSRYIS